MYELTKTLFRIEMDANDILLNHIFDSELLKTFTERPVQSEKISRVYGDLAFPKAPENRPYVYGSFITTIDGKIAFPDARDSALLQHNNFLDGTHGKAPFFVFMLQRACADAIIAGAGTMREEPNMTMHLMDVDLEQARIDNNLPPVPLNIISTLDGTDLDFNHLIFTKDEVPKMINTSPAGYEIVKQQMKQPHYLIGPFASMDDVHLDALRQNMAEHTGLIPVVVTGSGAQTDSHILFYILKHLGVERLLIETPAYTHHLLEEQLIDELFLNYACMYIGGNAMAIGLRQQPFTSTHHPHSRMLSIVNAQKSPENWFCMRHQMVYNVDAPVG
ncbi:dihydrofolate reductase family protein [Eubacteriales bacterium OttesenSCG-928-N14]|nr:dihydrofolate reductase family protein [Eubacteriales bacterium OttesenSCG-928-N14]